MQKYTFTYKFKPKLKNTLFYQEIFANDNIIERVYPFTGSHSQCDFSFIKKNGHIKENDWFNKDLIRALRIQFKYVDGGNGVSYLWLDYESEETFLFYIRFYSDKKLRKESIEKINKILSKLCIYILDNYLSRVYRNSIKVNRLIDILPNIDDIKSIYNNSTQIKVILDRKLKDISVIFKTPNKKYEYHFHYYYYPILRYLIYCGDFEEITPDIRFLTEIHTLKNGKIVNTNYFLGDTPLDRIPSIYFKNPSSKFWEKKYDLKNTGSIDQQLKETISNLIALKNEIIAEENNNFNKLVKIYKECKNKKWKSFRT